jgi:transketolase N-terminal domain/subunit
MARDPIVDEVRAARTAIAREHGNDLQAIVAALERKEGADGRPVVSFAARGTKKPTKRKAG